MSRRSASPPVIERDRHLPSLPSTMLDLMFPPQDHRFYRERPPLHAVHSCLLENRLPSGLETTRSHSRTLTSNFSPSINPNSTLISANSPLDVRIKSQSPPHQYQTYDHIYPDHSNPPRTSGQEETSYSPLHFYQNSESHETPPPPFWGAFNISPSTARAPSPQARYNNRDPVQIAPNPHPGSDARRRHHNHNISHGSQRSRKRPTSTREAHPVEYNFSNISKEERLLVRLKLEMKLPWKEITKRWEEETGKEKHEAALQMQFKRLKERVRIWLPSDLTCLTKAVRKVGNMQWEKISMAMLQYGIQEKWTKAACRDKWENLNEQELHIVKLQIAKEREWTPPLSYCDRTSPNPSDEGSNTSAYESSNDGAPEWQSWIQTAGY